MNQEKKSFKLISQIRGIFTSRETSNNIQGSATNPQDITKKRVKRKRTPNWMYRNE